MTERKDFNERAFDAQAFDEWAVGVLEGDKEAIDYDVDKYEQAVYFWYTDDLDESPEVVYWSEWK